MQNYTAKYKKLLLQLEADSEYTILKESFLEAQQALQAVISELEPANQIIIYEYLGTLAELQMREIELALATKS